MTAVQRIVVIGAGLAGLSAATRLVGAGHSVVVLDKGRGPGGRMATRRIGAATVDHGAQFFTVRSDEFAAEIQPHLDSGLVVEWCTGFSPEGDGHPRYAVRGGMNALTKFIAAPLDVRCNSLAFAVRHGERLAWSVSLDDGTAIEADAVIVTCPVPQSYSLVMPSGIELPEALIRTEYDRTISLLLELSDAPLVPEPGGLQNPSDILSFVADNQRKGVSGAPALTLHANATWSEDHWGDDVATVTTALAVAAVDFIGGAVIIEAQVKRWRFGTPRTIWPDRCWTAPFGRGPIVLAGDAFGGPKVEGAVLSGQAAASAVLSS